LKMQKTQGVLRITSTIALRSARDGMYCEK
jgi:hypothetical protein